MYFMKNIDYTKMEDKHSRRQFLGALGSALAGLCIPKFVCGNEKNLEERLDLRDKIRANISEKFVDNYMLNAQNYNVPASIELIGKTPKSKADAREKFLALWDIPYNSLEDIPYRVGEAEKDISKVVQNMLKAYVNINDSPNWEDLRIKTPIVELLLYRRKLFSTLKNENRHQLSDAEIEALYNCSKQVGDGILKWVDSGIRKLGYGRAQREIGLDMKAVYDSLNSLRYVNFVSSKS